MVFPSINQLSQGKYDKYTLVIATAKCARAITDEYVIQREYAERKIANKETDKSIAAPRAAAIYRAATTTIAYIAIINGSAFFFFNASSTPYQP